MDTESFLLKRQELQTRMEERRRQTLEHASSWHSGIIPWAFRRGFGFLTGLGANGGSAGVVRSVLFAVVVPALLEMMRRGGDSLVQKLLHGIFPGSSSRELSKQ